MKHIELRGDNLLKAVIEGTEANAHLIATNAFAWGVEHAMEQYNLSEDKVFAAMHYYLNNRVAIETQYDAINATSSESAEDQKQRFLEQKARRKAKNLES